MTAIRGANLAWQLGGDVALVRELADDPSIDALVLLECRDFANRPVDVKEILGDGWWVGQNTTNGALSGTAIAIRKGGTIRRRRFTAAFRRLRQISKGNSEVQARYLRAVPINDGHGNATLMGAHIPKKSSGEQDDALDETAEQWRATRGRKFLFMDGNGDPSTVARHITAPHFDGNGVMVWVWSQGVAGVRVFWNRIKGSDHKVGTLRAN